VLGPINLGGSIVLLPTAGELPVCLISLSLAYGILAYKSAIVTITRETEEVERRKPH